MITTTAARLAAVTGIPLRVWGFESHTSLHIYPDGTVKANDRPDRVGFAVTRSRDDLRQAAARFYRHETKGETR